MKKFNVLVCDVDEAYVDALVSYLMEKESSGGMGISVTGISEINNFEKLRGNFELAFLGSPYFEESRLMNELRILNKVRLLEEMSDEVYEEKTFFKYQSMDALEGLIRISLHIGSNKRPGESSGKMQIVGVYSPGKHELSLPFALCMCKFFMGKGEVLFVDLSEIGILRELVGESIRDFREDLIDVIYMLENGDVTGGLEKFIAGYEGFSLLTPVATPSQLSYITPEQWKLLFEKIEGSGYSKVVVLFGSLVQGFAELAGGLESLLVLEKNGDYYEIADRAFMEFMDRLALKNLCKEVVLPMSASNLSHGSFRMDALINGRLMEFVKSQMGGSLGELADSL